MVSQRWVRQNCLEYAPLAGQTLQTGVTDQTKQAGMKLHGMDESLYSEHALDGGGLGRPVGSLFIPSPTGIENSANDEEFWSEVCQMQQQGVNHCNCYPHPL